MKALLQDVPLALRHNFIVYYWDIAVWGLYTGSTIVFLNVYATREGATSAQIGLLSAGPAIVSLLLSVPAGILARRWVAKTSVVVSALVARILLLGFIFVPLLLSPADQVQAFIILTILMAVPNTVLNVCFGPLMLSAIPAEWRGHVVAFRNALMSVISFAVTLICGQILVYVSAPLGYQIVFFIGFLGAIATVYILSKVRVLQPVEMHVVPTGEGGVLRALLPHRDPAGRQYVVVMLMLFAMTFTGFMGVPLVPQFTVNSLHLNDAVISIGSAVSNFLVFAVSLFVMRLTRRYGNRHLTAASAVLLMFYYVAMAFATDAILFLVAAVIAGCASGILSAASFNYLLDSLPQNDQTAWMSWFMTLSNVAVLAGSLAGPVVANAIGIPATFIVLGLMRLLIGVMIYLRG